MVGSIVSVFAEGFLGNSGARALRGGQLTTYVYVHTDIMLFIMLTCFPNSGSLAQHKRHALDNKIGGQS